METTIPGFVGTTIKIHSLDQGFRPLGVGVLVPGPRI